MTEESKVANPPMHTPIAQASSEETRSLVPQLVNKAVVVEVDSTEVPDIGSALLQLQSAIKQMTPDDISLEYSEDRSATRSTTRLRLRAYRKLGG